MKLMTKRLLAVMLTLALTLGMAISAMAALPNLSDDVLASAGLDPEKAELIVEWTEVSAPAAGAAASKQTGAVIATENSDGTYTVDLSKGMYLGDYTHITMFHNVGGNIESKTAANGAAIWKSLSPFCLVGEKIEAASDDDDDAATSDDDDDDDDDSSSSSKKSSSKSKSPKTGMDESWMLWLIAAGVLAGSSVVAYNKKRG